MAHRARVHKFDLSGGAIMEDFDNDGLLDLVVTSYDTAEAMVYYRNLGNGRFEKRSRRAGLSGQLGGLYAVQTDYNNDGRMDVFVVRGAWLRAPVRPSLLRNNGNGTFSDVTQKAGLGSPINAISASWADYDNDGHLDVFIPCESQPNRLYRNKGDGTFEEVSARAGVRGTGRHGKGAAWLDYDNDGYPDLFVTYYEGYSQLLRNNRNGTFTDVTNSMKVKGPRSGFSTWAFDYNNDGFLDIFAASGESRLIDVIRGLFGKSAGQNKLYRNIGGKRFVDVTKEAGLDVAFAAMGSNYGDFDNDGYLDIYLGTGAPDVSFLVPNRMLKNVAGQRFEDISVSSGTAHLQKGHAVAIGDIRRVGKVDLYVQMGGAITGDKFHNLLFQNPGQGHNWITLKLVGQKTNRAAIGARIKVVSGGSKPLVVHRHVSSGSSFGANPLEQTIGLGMQKRIKLLEIYWPTSKTTQRFRNVSINQAIKIVEFQKGYRVLFKGPKSNKQ